MKITKVAKAGTLESNDILVMVSPNEDGGVNLLLESIVIKQFGDQIRKVILEKVDEMEIKDISIKAQDKGALDFAIAARVEAAIKRAVSE
ncbi:citrate lyase acyl carrier protein [Clostridium swellfunianum]|uniref:citrate lyase acyl carrier protein n=1 Tax=Clostridium swellfunianum TaxID=1367462 RepID=UPI0020308A14|nr:citrate lyase acyl carrier protein [Clostridium swellfunianum]MCM0649439.1 citrate lyase acyl carrier protein [Clostridium swellfunianum]